MTTGTGEEIKTENDYTEFDRLICCIVNDSAHEFLTKNGYKEEAIKEILRKEAYLIFRHRIKNEVKIFLTNNFNHKDEISFLNTKGFGRHIEQVVFSQINEWLKKVKPIIKLYCDKVSLTCPYCSTNGDYETKTHPFYCIYCHATGYLFETEYEANQYGKMAKYISCTTLFAAFKK